MNNVITIYPGIFAKIIYIHIFNFAMIGCYSLYLLFEDDIIAIFLIFYKLKN